MKQNPIVYALDLPSGTNTRAEEYVKMIKARMSKSSGPTGAPPEVIERMHSQRYAGKYPGSGHFKTKKR